VRSLRGKFLLAFVAFALLAIGGMTLAAEGILRERARAHARVSFTAARAQLVRSLKLRYETFVAVSDLSYVLPGIRDVASMTDEADFGLGTDSDDRDKLQDLHENLSAADFGWSKATERGFFAVADYKGRLVYSSAASAGFGGDVKRVRAIAEAYDEKQGFAGAMLVRGDDPELARAGLLGGPRPGALLVFARATVLAGVPRAVFIQITDARRVLDEVALGEAGTALALVAPDGAVEGNVPDPVLHVGFGSGSEPRAVDALGAHWLVQTNPLSWGEESTPIASIVLARNLDVGLAVLLAGARRLLLLSGGLLGVALLLAVSLSRRLARPIVELESAAQRVAGGDLNAAVEPTSGDEIGRLARAFNQMTEGLRERERIKLMFKRYLAPDVVDYLLVHPEAVKLGGERKTLTVMFSDLAGFTSMSENSDPALVVQILNTYFSKVSERISARGGVVDKYIGDAVMSFFGAPVPLENHALQACLAALDHLDALDELGPLSQKEAWPELSARIGINTGEVIVGNIGGEQSQDYTVIGDSVNLASRLEGANKEYGTRALVSESVWVLAQHALEGRELDLIRLSGRQKPVRVYELIGLKGALESDPKRRLMLREFAEGLALYRAREFQHALSAFERALAAVPRDGPSRAYCERSRRYLVEPPDAEWDGVYSAKSK